jgi:hypothetical protein
VEINYWRKAKELQIESDVLKCAFLEPWIPIVPDSGEGPHLDEEWEENDWSGA